jgi:hypothetical protein
LLANYVSVLKLSQKYKIALDNSETLNRILGVSAVVLLLAVIAETYIIANHK